MTMRGNTPVRLVRHLFLSKSFTLKPLQQTTWKEVTFRSTQAWKHRELLSGILAINNKAHISVTVSEITCVTFPQLGLMRCNSSMCKQTKFGYRLLIAASSTFTIIDQWTSAVRAPEPCCLCPPSVFEAVEKEETMSFMSSSVSQFM